MAFPAHLMPTGTPTTTLDRTIWGASKPPTSGKDANQPTASCR